MAKEDSRFEDFPKDQFLKAGSQAQGVQDAQSIQGAQSALNAKDAQGFQDAQDAQSAQKAAGRLWPDEPHGLAIPHPCGVGGVGQGGACPGQALQSLGSRAAINWVFHTLPCQGRVEVGGRGLEVQKGLGEETSSMSHCLFPWIRFEGQLAPTPGHRLSSAGCRA